MAQLELLSGPNFSGRSDRLLAGLREREAASFFIGPYAEAALSGLSATVSDEITLYHAGGEREAFAAADIARQLARKPQNLSGGEQVMLALHCLSVSAFDRVAIDTALEQLDDSNRQRALDYLAASGRAVALIDNRVAELPRYDCTICPPTGAHACDWDALAALIRPRQSPEIVVHDLTFGYRKGHDIFRRATVTLTPATAYRLSGANGAGKTTLLKLLVGALAPTEGWLTLGGARYEPWRRGNTALALATQNPDQQWCGATLAEDMARRRRAPALRNAREALSDARLFALAQATGLGSPDQHLYELPLAARKRASWLWPLTGAHPWLMLDEPTIGQDGETRAQLAKLVAELCDAGYGILFVTHDDAFAARIPHRRLQVADGAITPQ